MLEDETVLWNLESEPISWRFQICWNDETLDNKLMCDEKGFKRVGMVRKGKIYCNVCVGL